VERCLSRALAAPSRLWRHARVVPRARLLPRALAWEDRDLSHHLRELEDSVGGVLLAAGLAVARPSYGIAGMVLVIVAFEPAPRAGVAVGIPWPSSSAVRSTEDDRSTVFLGTCVSQSAAHGDRGRLSLLFPGPGPFARFYGEPQVQPLFAVLSLIFRDQPRLGLDGTRTCSCAT